ncbi:DUF1178 family protein [Leisingera sp. M527]|uniref:DUF1178 family protein n=1 Tax=unclassified Leisingera TaxID=2614906 RepID=UPI0021A86ED0|nr:MULTISPECIES: DUF1178 family protein [unclassified Leisingera]UWQ29630.1 DUF1178 family protein [Leisingera sp. M523]UWQ31821.1 DUF1178 family protein [Leisingera sp. M527]UWQ73810.1 DUF1178 family protein [Leisingera sp. M658]
MIQYSLKCTDGHSFDSWFQSAAAFDKLAAAGLVSCAVCGGAQVEKAIMAPRVRPGRKAVSAVGEPEPQAAAPAAPAAVPAAAAAAPAGPGMLSRPAGEVEQAIAELRKKVEANSDYVGGNFVQEARAMHLGDAPERAIHGEAKLEDARELIEEGVPVMPLPFRSGRKSN